MKERLEAYKAKTGKTWVQVAKEIGCAVGYLYEIRRGDKTRQSELFINRMSDLEKGEGQCQQDTQRNQAVAK